MVVTSADVSPGRTWTLLSNHGRLLLLIAADPQIRLRDMAASAAITERAAGSIVSDLEHAGYITRHRVGRRNTYELHTDKPFRHQAEAGHTVGELVDLFHDAG